MPRTGETKALVTELHAVIVGHICGLHQTQLDVTAEQVDLPRTALDLTLQREVNVSGRMVPIKLMKVPLRILTVEIVGIFIIADSILRVLVALEHIGRCSRENIEPGVAAIINVARVHFDHVPVGLRSADMFDAVNTGLEIGSAAFVLRRAPLSRLADSLVHLKVAVEILVSIRTGIGLGIARRIPGHSHTDLTEAVSTKEPVETVLWHDGVDILGGRKTPTLRYGLVVDVVPIIADVSVLCGVVPDSLRTGIPRFSYLGNSRGYKGIGTLVTRIDRNNITIRNTSIISIVTQSLVAVLADLISVLVVAADDGVPGTFSRMADLDPP